MAILDKVHKIIPRIKTAAGYIQYAFRAKDVRMEDNTDLETKITEINNNLINLNNKPSWHRIKREGFLSANSTSTWTLNDVSFYDKAEVFMLRLGNSPKTSSEGTYCRCLSSTIIPKDYLLIGQDNGSGCHQCRYNDMNIGISFLSKEKIKVYAGQYCLVELMAWY